MAFDKVKLDIIKNKGNTAVSVENSAAEVRNIINAAKVNLTSINPMAIITSNEKSHSKSDFSDLTNIQINYVKAIN